MQLHSAVIVFIGGICVLKLKPFIIYHHQSYIMLRLLIVDGIVEQWSKPGPLSGHFGYSIHSQAQLPAAVYRDFSLAIFKASYLFSSFLGQGHVLFPYLSQAPLSAAFFLLLFIFLCDQSNP